MNRHARALECIQRPTPLVDLARSLVESIEESTLENKDASTDPAVILIGMQIGFLIHTDVSNRHMYDKLVGVCRQNKSTPATPNKERH